jgi:hypothetical protein
MHVRHWVSAALAVGALAGPALAAQERESGRARGSRDAAEWLEECEENRRHDDDDGDDRVRFCEVRESRLRATGRTLTVDGRQNGGIDVEAWDGDGILLQARIQAQAPTMEEARQIASGVRIDTAGPTISASGPATSGRRSWWVGYLILVPRRTNLDLSTHNGPIHVEGVTGRMELRAVNGPLALDDVGGDVRGRTQNGPLAITLGGARWDGAGLDAETRNGPLILELPRKYGARLETGTQNGPMDIDFPITLQGRIGRRITTTLGAGGPLIRAVTTNGPLVIRER